jgi:acyl carrier protein
MIIVSFPKNNIESTSRRKLMDKLLEIINIIKDNKDEKKLTNLTEEMNLREDIGFDSLDLAELTVRIEKEFDVDVFEDGLVNTIKEIIEKIRNNG